MCGCTESDGGAHGLWLLQLICAKRGRWIIECICVDPLSAKQSRSQLSAKQSLHRWRQHEMEAHAAPCHSSASAATWSNETLNIAYPSHESHMRWQAPHGISVWVFALKNFSRTVVGGNQPGFSDFRETSRLLTLIGSFPLMQLKNIKKFWHLQGRLLNDMQLNTHKNEPPQWLIIYYGVLTHQRWAPLTEHFKVWYKTEGASFLNTSTASAEPEEKKCVAARCCPPTCKVWPRGFRKARRVWEGSMCHCPAALSNSAGISWRRKDAEGKLMENIWTVILGNNKKWTKRVRVRSLRWRRRAYLTGI